ncbi:MAG: divalent-cation tolerance protein CutA [Chitinispirillales bacterium]|jgi:periplasmic divalent cation tolerance protein|nr:divalent-cation tolerance protein CutA [Chitinispirillales bacterium]
MDPIFVYITAKDKEQALFIGKTLVRERLCACVNILDSVTSIYWWEGEIAADNEAVLIAKTSSEKFDALSERVNQLHTYSCPCIVALPVTHGNAQYLEWIKVNLSW